MNIQNPPPPPHHPKDKMDQVIQLLEQNNKYLQKISHTMHKDQRRDTYRMIYHALMTIIPLLLVLYVTWYLYDMVNSNVEALRLFIEKITPNFDGIGKSLKEGWNDLKFWN